MDSNKASEREIRHRSIARRIAADGIVLLKNDKVLPLCDNKAVALYGGGSLHPVIGGTGSGSVNVRDSVSIADGLRGAGIRIANEDWLAEYEAAYAEARVQWEKKIYAEAGDNIEFSALYHAHATNPFRMPKGSPVKAANTDTAIYVISRISGEGADRKAEKGDYYLSEDEEETLRDLCTLYEKIIVILNVGGVIDLTFMDKFDRIKALVLLSQPGMEGGNALADILTGTVTPGGRLTDTWGYHYEDYPCAETFGHNNGDLEKEYYREGIYVGYRWFETFGIKPRYPFGYGLSYTDFEQTVESVSVNYENSSIDLSIKVENTGKSSGKEVVQVYLAKPLGKCHKENKSLVAFEKTQLLEPLQKETLMITFPFTEFAIFAENLQQYVIEKGDYYLLLGSSAAETRVIAKATLDQEIHYGHYKHICPLVDPLTEILPDREKQRSYINSLEESVCKTTKVIHLNAEKMMEGFAFRENVIYEPLGAKKILDKLSDRQKATLVCGKISNGSAEMIGGAGITVVGAAGETSDILKEEYGLFGVTMADGPAGLRLQARCEINPADGSVYGMTGYEKLQNRFFGTEFLHGSTEFKYQYCTAIPVGTMLAQTFDRRLVRKVGQLIAAEMQEFGVGIWLAPGMNIHRNPLCGRNFEYYSEDPVLSGEIASAMVQGVEKMPQLGTTIKHFACNNQEDNRMGVSAIVSERALREMYLKGFEIVIKKVKPAAVMTSYNKINGIHSANNYDLCTEVLRKEWGFEGLIVTDWTTTAETGGSSSAGCMLAGNDLIMPGTENDIENILAALHGENGIEVKKALDLCALRMIAFLESTKEKVEGI